MLKGIKKFVGKGQKKGSTPRGMNIAQNDNKFKINKMALLKKAGQL